MTAVRRVRDLARAALPRSVGERLPAAPPQEVTQLLHDKRFQRAVAAAADEQGRAEEEVWSEVKGYLHEMAAAHDDRTAQGWARLGDWFLRAYDVLVDEDDMQQLRRLDRSHSLALAFSHRSYLDGMVIPNALSSRRFSPTYTFGGANLNLPVIGTVASRTGLIFIRRATQEIPVYRLALRSYIRQMVTNKRNLAWSIEGGRTRTGKLRPPVHGILKYLTDTVQGDGEGDPFGQDAPDVQVVPLSVVYDQLHEVSLMTEEARGASKTPEDWRWLVRFARLQRNRLGRAYLTVGEPFSLRDRMAELAAEGVTGHQAVERVALDISHRINRATPVTTTAIVSLALLGADRALTVDEVLDTVEPLAAYIDARHWPVAGAADLRDRSTIRRALAELTLSGVLTAYDRGTEPVWKIGDDQHLVAAFYRNTVIHILVERAIGELALLTVSELEPGAELPPGGELQVGWEEAKRMRDLLKFEFFFPSRAGFEDDLRTELRLLVGEGVTEMTPVKARELLVRARPHLAHLVLRPFLDAYLVVADRLADRGDGPVDEADLLADSLAVGQQWALQRRVASEESISLELFRTALALARHKGLLEGGEGVGSAREAFAVELRDSVRRVNIIGEIAGDTITVGHPQSQPHPGPQSDGRSACERAVHRGHRRHRGHRGRTPGAVGRGVLRPRRHARRRLHRRHLLRRPAQGPRRLAGGVPAHRRHRRGRRARRRPDAHRPRRLLGHARGVGGGLRRPRRAALPVQDRRHHPARVPRARAGAPAGRPHRRRRVGGHEVPDRPRRPRPRRRAPRVHPAGRRGRPVHRRHRRAHAVGAPQGQRRPGLRARARGRPRPVLRLRQRLRGRRLPVLRRPPHRAQPAPRPARRGRAPGLARPRPQRPGRRLAARRRTYGRPRSPA